MKIAIVTCYKQNDYVRTRTLRTAFANATNTLIVRNHHRGLLRYPEVAIRLIKTRLIDRPDAYVITFRGYEMLLLMVISFVRKPIVFDELVNFTEWMEEHGRLKAGSVAYKIFRWWYGRLARRCRFILADTDAHAEHSAILNKLSVDHYRTIPVGADETVFRPQPTGKTASKNFTVLYYGSMLALHGWQHVLAAASLLKDNSSIEFRIVGGKKKVAESCMKAAAEGARVTHESWLPFEELPGAISEAGLTLGGPFGGTVQAEFVITGKTFQPLASAMPVLIGKNRVNEGFSDKVNCLMVPQADPKALAEAITWAHEHPEKLRSIGLAGRQLYDRHFSQEVINDRVQQIIKEL